MKVFIVEDSAQTRKELVDLLTGEKGIDVVGHAGSVREAITGIKAALPEAVIVDISLPDGSGVEILKFIRLRGWNLCEIVLTPEAELRAARFLDTRQLEYVGEKGQRQIWK